MGEREIAALLRQLEGEEAFGFTEGNREEIIDPGFDDVPDMWEALGVPDAQAGLRSSTRAMLDDGDEAAW